MLELTKDWIKKEIAESGVVYKRGENIFQLGSYFLKEADFKKRSFQYYIDGNYGDYDVNIDFKNGDINYSCTCPFYSDGCKHTVAVCMDVIEQIKRHHSEEEMQDPEGSISETELLSYDEIKRQAIDDRKKSAKNESFDITLGDTYKGEHLITTTRGKQYVVTSS
ncbi:hypothetical protein MNBD_GAMMA03-984 [hydrothermal vent metagenome]|uniref:SWIM-type domain-containing protein n=1 Tax=hydrothermal vent metagenome TaxID=652676 RepID=A0A3B0VY63_9ZZZZ